MIKTKKEELKDRIDLTNIKNKPKIIQGEDFGNYYILDSNNNYLMMISPLEYKMIDLLLDLEKRIEKLEK